MKQGCRRLCGSSREPVEGDGRTYACGSEPPWTDFRGSWPMLGGYLWLFWDFSKREALSEACSTEHPVFPQLQGCVCSVDGRASHFALSPSARHQPHVPCQGDLFSRCIHNHRRAPVRAGP